MATSPNDTAVTGIGASVTDASGNVWTIDPSGQITVNGTVDPTTANVDELVYENGDVWQKNTSNDWFYKASPAAVWVSSSFAPLVPDVSAEGTTIAAGSNATIIDDNGNVWGLADSGQVVVDGAIDPTTANVVELALVSGTIWQENAAGLWFSKTAPADPWSSGTTINPLPRTWLGGGDNLASDPVDWSPGVAPEPGDALTMNSGTMNLVGDALAGDTLAIGPNGTVDINASGAAALTLQAIGSDIEINIAAGETLALAGGANLSYVDVSGGTASIATTYAASFDTVFSDDLVGTGTIGIYGGNADGSTVETAGSVATGLTFDIEAPGPGDAGLQIDQPSAFHGNVVLEAGWVALMGLQATSAELSGGVLALYNGSTLVDAIQFVSAPDSPGQQPLEVQQNSQGVMISSGNGASLQPGGAGTVLPVTDSSVPPGVNVGPPDDFMVADQTTGGSWQAQGTAYTGPVAGLTSEIIIPTSDNINITAQVPNVFISADGGSGEDAIAVNAVNGNNVLNGSTGSSFLFGGSGDDTFFVDDRDPAANIWSTVVNFHSGDNATIWGITPGDFTLSWTDGAGAAGYSGLTLTATAAGQPTAMLTLAGLTSADLTNGVLSVSYGTTSSVSGVPGSNYMLIHAN